MAFNTNNPLGSSDPRDLFDNSTNLDEGMNSIEETFLDRFGRPRNTYQAFHNLVINAKNEVGPTIAAAKTAVNASRDEGVQAIEESVAAVETVEASAKSEMQETAANLGNDLNNKHYLTYSQMTGDPQVRDAVLAYVDADPTPALNGFYSWDEASSTWKRSDKQLVFKSQMDQRLDPLAEQQRRSQVSLAPKVTVTDRSSGPALEILPEGAEEAVVAKIGNSGVSAYEVDTKRKRLIDHLVRVIGKGLAFASQGVVAQISSFFHWEVTGDLSFKGGKGTEVSVSGDGVRIGVGGAVGSEQNSAFRHRSGRLMSKVDHGLYTGDLSYIGSDFIAPNRPSDVPVVIPAANAPERGSRIIQGCPSVAVVGNRIWVAFFGGIQNNHESMYDFQVLKYSDDGGSTWVEWAYWVQSPAVARLSTVYLHLDERGILWVFSGTDHVFSINPDDQLGCWAFTIKDPLSDKPTASSMWRVSSLGYPSYINAVDERLIMPLQIQESMTQIVDRKGVHLFEFDPTCRGMTRAGRLPLVGNTDWQESSVIQLKSGKLMAMYRTTAGQMACFSDTGELNTWGAPSAMSTFLGPNPGSRACLRRTPKGNLILAYNAASTREHMTLALLNDEGSGMIHSKLLDVMETSYPDIAFDGAGNILVVWDRERAVERTIMLSIISEDDFVANGESAAQNIIVVDSKKDA